MEHAWLDDIVITLITTLKRHSKKWRTVNYSQTSLCIKSIIAKWIIVKGSDLLLSHAYEEFLNLKVQREFKTKTASFIIKTEIRSEPGLDHMYLIMHNFVAISYLLRPFILSGNVRLCLPVKAPHFPNELFQQTNHLFCHFRY